MTGTQLTLGEIHEARFDTELEARDYAAQHVADLIKSGTYEYLAHSIDYTDATFRVQIHYREV